MTATNIGLLTAALFVTMQWPTTLQPVVSPLILTQNVMKYDWIVPLKLVVIRVEHRAYWKLQLVGADPWYRDSKQQQCPTQLNVIHLKLWWLSGG